MTDLPVDLVSGDADILNPAGNTMRPQTRQTLKELRAVIRIVQPATMINWHRELIRQTVKRT